MEKILATLRNPMIFNGLAILAYLTIGETSLRIELWPTPKVIVVAVSLGMIALVTAWLNYFAWKNPRFLAYGPSEYIRESELAHERILAGK
jgi:hypothetical protein